MLKFYSFFEQFYNIMVTVTFINFVDNFMDNPCFNKKQIRFIKTSYFSKKAPPNIGTYFKQNMGFFKVHSMHFMKFSVFPVRT